MAKATKLEAGKKEETGQPKRKAPVTIETANNGKGTVVTKMEAPKAEPSELVIKELMIQKGLTREQAIDQLKS